MRTILILIILCVIPSFVMAEELISFILDDSQSGIIIPGEIINHPVRQLRFIHPYAATPHGEAPVLLTLTGLEEELTQKYIEQFLSPNGRKMLAAVVERSGPYLSFIRSEIERRGLPQELIFLPIIESAYSADAVSRSGATGLWQFMKISIGPHDMKITEWMDERRDFWKSTVAALDKLETEYKRVGSWELALAAYNAGLGTVLNALKKYPEADYWELCRLKVFKKETINYVPKLVAVSWVLSNLRLYGFDAKWPEDPQWTRIPVGRSVDLSLVAQHAGLTDFDLKKANSELIFGITPPDPSYYIKVPSEHAPSVVSVLEDPELTLIKYYFHIIRSGDTLSGIARNYGVSESQIRSSNPGLQEKFLKIGQQLIIPVLKNTNAGAAAARQDSAPAAVQQTAAAGTTVQQPAAPVRLSPSAASTNHLVKRGETLWSIARAYNLNPGTLAEFNNMGLNDVLRVGSTLKIPAKQ